MAIATALAAATTRALQAALRGLFARNAFAGLRERHEALESSALALSANTAPRMQLAHSGRGAAAHTQIGIL